MLHIKPNCGGFKGVADPDNEGRVVAHDQLLNLSFCLCAMPGGSTVSVYNVSVSAHLPDSWATASSDRI